MRTGFLFHKKKKKKILLFNSPFCPHQPRSREENHQRGGKPPQKRIPGASQFPAGSNTIRCLSCSLTKHNMKAAAGESRGMWHPQTQDLVLVHPRAPTGHGRAPDAKATGCGVQGWHRGTPERDWDPPTAPRSGAAGWWHWEGSASAGDESGKRSKTQTNKTGIAERNHPSARSRQQLVVTR